LPILRFNFSEVLPSRILLFGGETLQDLEESKQRLIAYPWIGPGGSKKLNFLQLPKVEIVEPNYEVEAVISAGSREIQGEEKEIEIKTEVVPEPAMEEPVKSVETEESTEFLAEEENEKDDFPEEDFGFVKKEDILITHPQSNFSIPENVPEEDIPQEVVSKEQSFSPPNTFKKEKKVNLSKILSIFTLLIRKIVYFPVKLIKALGHLFFTKKTIFPLLIIFLTVGLAVAFFVSFVKAEVKVLAKSLTVEKEFDFTVSNKTNALDKEKMIVPAKEITAEISDDKTADVSGKKTVGDKARGEVVIYNRTEQSKTFAKGAVLKGIGGVKFVLQAEVTVASKSADLQNGVDKWGEGKVSVQAQEIGTQGNLAANSLLNFETLSSSLFLIKNPAAFSGGTSREVQAVSKEDRENLQKNLLKEMEGKAKGEIEKKLPKESSLLVESIYLKNKVDKFDHEVDDEADSLSLEEKVVYSAFYFQNSDLEVLIDKAISSAIPENYEKKTIREEKNFVVKDKAKGLYHAKVKQDFLPLLDMEKIPLALKGKTLNEGEEYLKSLSNLSGIEITFKPNFLAKLGIFPLRAKNINVFLEKQ
ncbi:MAG: baseplate J/gp47 family protein, partial [Patescibacteria group bacterium]|nr:baseplate J/gp47 family protein [Patescibacteria group bacterium]